MNAKKTIAGILIFVCVLFAALLALRFVFGGPEDDWICEVGGWEKHGNPSSPMPSEPCNKG